jgi:hypothetical protein
MQSKTGPLPGKNSRLAGTERPSRTDSFAPVARCARSFRIAVEEEVKADRGFPGPSRSFRAYRRDFLLKGVRALFNGLFRVFTGRGESPDFFVVAVRFVRGQVPIPSWPRMERPKPRP